MPNQLTAQREKSKITEMKENIVHEQIPAPANRRLLAIFYDSFLLIAVLFLAMAVLLLISGGYEFQAGNPLITTYLLLVSFVFYGWFWTHGGQTLGMRAWKLQIQQKNGTPINWQHAALRFITALPAWLVIFIGIALVSDIQLATYPWLNQLSMLTGWLIFIVGIAWLVVDQWPDGWRDKVSRTRIVKLNH